MDENQHNEELNFNGLIGNLLTSHNEEQNNIIIITTTSDGGSAVVGDKDFTSIVNNAVEFTEPITDSSNGDSHGNYNTVREFLIDEEQQNERAHILQQGLYEEDIHGENSEKNIDYIHDTYFNDDALDQDDEYLKRAILETLQVLSDESMDENMSDNGDREATKQVEILHKLNKSPLKKKKKKKKKKKEKDKQTSDSNKKISKESSENEDKKRSKSKKNHKEREKSKLSKNENKKNNIREPQEEANSNNNNHLIQTDDVIKGIMRSDTLLESGDLKISNNDFNENNKLGIDNDTNDFETQTMMEATVKAFENELLDSKTSSVSIKKSKKRPTITKTASSKNKKKSTAKKTVKSKASTSQPSTFITSSTTTTIGKDLDYEIPTSVFYPQPKKKKVTESVVTNKKPKNVTVKTGDSRCDDFSKVLTGIVNQVVETSLAEPIEVKEKEKEKIIEKEASEYVIDSSSKPIQKNNPDYRVSKDNSTIAQTKEEQRLSINERAQYIFYDKEEDNDESFDLNQIIQNVISLTFQSRPKDIEETKERSSLKEKLEKIQNESRKPVKLQDLDKVKKVKGKDVHETHKKLNEDEQGSTDEERIKKGKKKKMKSKKVDKTKKTKKINKSDIIKVKPPKKPKEKLKTSQKKTFKSSERKKFETIIIDNFEKKLANNSMNNATSSMRKLNAQTKSSVDHKNREIIIRNVEIEKQFTKLKNGLIMKSQSPEEMLKKKFGLIAAVAAHEARKRGRQKNKELRLKLKEEKEKVKIARKVQKELDRAKFDTEQKELAEIVARGPPYPPDLRLTKNGVPKKPYRRWTTEEMKLRSQLANQSIDEVRPKVKAHKANKNDVVAITNAPLFNFIRLNVVLKESNLKDIKEALLKIHLPESHFDYLFSNTGTLGYSTDEIVKALENRTLDKFDPSAKTIVHKERFLFHPPWVLPDYPSIALPVARRSISSKKHNKIMASGLHDTSAFMAVNKKLIPTILNPIINTLKTAAKKKIANGASPEEVTRHLLTIFNHTKKSIAQIITNARNRQLRQSLTKATFEDGSNKTTVSTTRPNNLNRIPLLITANRSKRPLENADIYNSNTKQENVLKVLPLVPLTKKAKRVANLASEVVIISDHKDTTNNNNLNKIVDSTESFEVVKPTEDLSNVTDGKKDISENGTVTESTSAKIVQTRNNQTPLQPTIIDLGMATASSDIYNETGESFKKDKTLLPPEFSALDKSSNSNDKISTETDSWEKVSGKVDNNPDEPGITIRIGVEALEEPSKQFTIVDKADNTASKPIHDNQVLLNGKNDSSTTPGKDLSATNNMTEECSKSVNSNKSDIDVVEVILEEPTLESTVSSITENCNIKTNNAEIEEATADDNAKSTNFIYQTVEIETEKNLKSQQDTVKPVLSKDNEEKKDAENFQEVIPIKNLNTDKNEINDKEIKKQDKEVIEVKKENSSESRKIPINIPNLSSKTITPNAQVKVESMIQSLVVQQLQNSNEEDDLANKIGALLIEEAKVEVEPKQKKRKIEKLTEGTKESADSSAVTNISESVSNDVESTKNVVTSDNSKDSSIEKNGNPYNISNDLQETSSNAIHDVHTDSYLVSI